MENLGNALILLAGLYGVGLLIRGLATMHVYSGHLHLNQKQNQSTLLDSGNPASYSRVVRSGGRY